MLKWCKNKIIIHANPENISLIKQILFDEGMGYEATSQSVSKDLQLKFDKLVPIPKTLDNLFNWKLIHWGALSNPKTNSTEFYTDKIIVEFETDYFPVCPIIYTLLDKYYRSLDKLIYAYFDQNMGYVCEMIYEHEDIDEIFCEHPSDEMFRIMRDHFSCEHIF